MIIIEINDPDRGESLTFQDVASAIVWVQDEIVRWERVLDPKIQESGFGIYTILESWRLVYGHIDDIRKANTKLGGRIDHTEFDDYRIVAFESKIGSALRFVLEKMGPLAASYATIAARVTNGDLNWNDDTVFRGVMLFDKIKRARTEFENAEREMASGGRIAHTDDRINEITTSIAKLDEMVASIANIASQQREQIDAELATYKAEAVLNWQQLSDQTKVIKKNVESWLALGENQLAESTKAGQAQVHAWIAAQGEQRQLEKPAELWAERARKHVANSKSWQLWSICVGIGGLVLAVIIALTAFHWARPLFEAAVLPGTSASVKAGAGTLRPTFHYELTFTGAITLAWLTMYLWTMRLLVRLYTTEHHLAIDASARGAMMEAYLGLIAADAANATDRPIVLQALFRPVQDGMVRDDGPPGLTPAALLSALATSPGKAA